MFLLIHTFGGTHSAPTVITSQNFETLKAALDARNDDVVTTMLDTYADSQTGVRVVSDNENCVSIIHEAEKTFELDSWAIIPNGKKE